MATATAFGIGGWEPISSLAEAGLNYGFSTLAANDALDRSKDLTYFEYELQRDLAQLEFDLNMKAYKYDAEHGPELRRQGLEAAGFNPILAVSSASGSPFHTSVPGVSSGRGEMADTSSNSHASVTGSLLEMGQRMAAIKQTDAQTELIKKRSLGEGWQIKTLSRSEAQGLGANLVHALGFNFHDSSQETFLVAYNPITGELRNLGNTESGLGTTGALSNAAEVKAIPVDWKTDNSPRYKFNPDDWELKPEFRK